MLSNPSNKYESVNALSKLYHRKKEYSPTVASLLKQVESILKFLKKPGVYTSTYMSATGFQYTGDGDAARCDNCGLEISNWTLDMDPFAIHSKQKPDCPYVRSITKSPFSKLPSSLSSWKKFSEIDFLQPVRRRTFSHWPHRTTPFSAQMVEARFFYCNIDDRVICLYCNLICQRWAPATDDPWEVHKTLSPNCVYVKAKLLCPSASSIIIINKSSTELNSSNHLRTSNNLYSLRSNEIVFTAACNPAYAELPKRHASFDTWPHENLPSVDDLVRAGFFYTGTKTIVTCFYCNGSLQNWGLDDKPMIQHALWFPNCGYVKQLCGDKRYRKIREAKRAQQERARVKESSEKADSSVMLNINPITDNGQLLLSDENTLSTVVAARLDLPMSQRLLDQNFKLSIIKRCWEDQLRLKQDDFVSQLDLYVACLIIRKQMEVIDGKKENIVIPNRKMKQIREQNKTRMREQTPNTTRSTSKSTTIDKQDETKTIKQTTSTTHDQGQSNDARPVDPCVLCLDEEKRLALLPCGHFATCVPCGHSLQSCPICRQNIEAFFRIYTEK